METFLIIALIVLSAVTLALLLKRDQRLDQIDQRIAQGLGQSSQTLQTQFSQHKDIIKDISEELTQIKETNKQVLGFSEKLQSLENILKNPKQRGILGEYFLESLLANVLQPNQYKIQYKFKSGIIVDAVVFFKDKIIPIDAKFSLEKFNMIMEEKDAKRREDLEKQFKQDIKNRIDETSKYIRPEEDTTDFAFMFIPAEGVYYNLLNYKVGDSDLIEYAFKSHVIIVSPTSFYAYLETVLQGLKALKMEEGVKTIIKRIGELSRHMNTYEDYFNKLGKHLDTSVNTYNKASIELKKIDKDVFRITEGTEGGKMKPELIDKA